MKAQPITIRILIAALLCLVTDISAQTGLDTNDITEEDQQETTGTFSLEGSLDTYFHGTVDTVEDAPNTAFSNLRGFSLGMINLILSYTSEKSGFVADLVYGPRGSDAVFNGSSYTNIVGSGSAQIINQMYAFYNFSEKVRVYFGQFNTFLGYELVTPTGNFHYSTSYLFSYGPFSHTGLRGEFDLGKGWALNLALMNPTDFTEYNPFDVYTIGGLLEYADEKNSISISAIAGDQDGKLRRNDTVNRFSAGTKIHLDLLAERQFSKKYYMSLNASYLGIDEMEIITPEGTKIILDESTGFYGVALYQKYSFSKSVDLGLRIEHFSEFNGGLGAIGGYDESGEANIQSATLSGNFTNGHLRLIPEVRVDIGTEKTFTEKSTGIPTNTLASFNLALVYTIPTLSYDVKSKKDN
jgi:hypothetical protein